MKKLDGRDPLERDVCPWPNMPRVVGDVYLAKTDLGRDVPVWRAHEGLPWEHCFWCHGHATLSYHIHRYSIFSGPAMEKVLADEWYLIPKKPLKGDIIIFRTIKGEYISHSARVEEALHRFGAPTAMRLSSKNGHEKLLKGVSIAEIERAYDESRWRVPVTGPCANGAVEKQYYRRKDRSIDDNYSYLFKSKS